MARQFNGTTDNGTVALTLGSPTLLTVSFWLFIAAYSNSDLKMVHNTKDGATAFNGCYFAPSRASSPAGTFDIAMTKTSSGGNFWEDSCPHPSVGAWHHVLLGHDRATPRNLAWIDGIPQTLTTVAHNTGALGTFTDPTITFGKYSTNFLAMSLCEYAIWTNVILGDADAATLALGIAATRVKTANNIGYWPDMAADLSGFGRPITLSGTTEVAGPAWTTALDRAVRPPAFPPIVPGHPAMSRSRVFFPSRPGSNVDSFTVALSGTSSLAATLTSFHAITVSLSGTGSLAPSITPYKRLTVTVAGTSALSATVAPYKRLAVALAGSSTLTGTLTAYKRLTATIAGTSSLAATLTPYQRITVSLAGTATLTATTTTYKRFSPALAGTSTLSASFTPLQRFTVTVAGTSSIAATLTRYQLITPTVLGTSSLTATVSRVAAPVAIAPRLAGTSTLTAGLIRYKRFAAVVGGTGGFALTLRAIGPDDGRPVSSLTGNTLSATGTSATSGPPDPSATDVETGDGDTAASTDGSETFAPIGG